MFDNALPMLILFVALVPYCYILARVASHGYFQAKLQYHNSLTADIMKEEADGKRKRA